MITSCSKYSVIGTWKRTNIQKFYPNQDSAQNSIGNLTLSQNSTFLVKGIDKFDTSNIPGWHTGSDIRGTWQQPDKKHIILLPSDMDRKFESLFNYKIVTLDENNLVIVSVFESDKKKAMTLRFTRQ